MAEDRMSADLQIQPDLVVLDQKTEQIVRNIGIPSCPAMLATLVREMRAEEPDFARIGKLVTSDVGLAAMILKTVNSPFFGLKTKATSVPQALSIMGLRNVVQLVTELLLRQAFPFADGEMMETLWEDSSSIAAICAWLAPRVRGVERDEAYTFGLFRDCGILTLMLKFSDYPRLFAASRTVDTIPLTEMEQKNYQIDHCQVGHYLAKSWHLPEPIYLAILSHHTSLAHTGRQTALAVASLKLIALGLVAEHLLGHYREGPASVEWQVSGASALECLGFSHADLITFTKEIHSLLAPAQ